MELGSLVAPGIVAAWGSAMPDERDFTANPYGCGWHVDRDRFDAMLCEAAVRAGVLIVEEEMPARFLIDATGRAAGERVYEERTVAIVVELSRGADKQDLRTTVESWERGWWYTSPIPQGGMMAMLFLDAEDYRRNGVVLGEALADCPLTQQRVEGEELARSKVVAADSSIRRSLRGECSSAEQWMAVGDSAASYDPLSGWGVGKALSQSALAADAVGQWLRGDPSGLVDYEARVRLEYQAYASQRRAYYELERRWPQSEFWRKRRRTS